ncbi:nucleoprotein [Marco virus]|uniref:Nucleoprotein n=1 Tax=Marco virus TaxID=1158190 RepID=A0A0D3R1B9_9RHAB|nr:nucleoprotein [Marco virus]AJR28448.1 nucleoprotein [Marco virus]
MEVKLQDLKSEETFSYEKVADQTDPQYPSTYFQEKAKPKLTISCQKIETKTLREFVMAGVLNWDIDIKYVNAYLHRVLSEVKSENKDRWHSFGLEIRAAGEDATPFDMYDVIINEDNPKAGITGVNVEAEVDKKLVLQLLFVYRYHNTPNSTHLATIESKFNDQLNAIDGPRFEYRCPDAKTKLWMQDPNFLKIVAGVDMFLCKFPSHNWAFLRFATIVSRFKDFAALTALDHLWGLLGIEGNEGMLWCWTPELGKEARRLLRPNQEISKPDSYTPYITTMGISLKSPYSATSCPATYNWAHIVGALLGSTRSRNARLFNENNLITIRTNASIMAYAFQYSACLEQQFSKDRATRRAEIEKKKLEQDNPDLVAEDGLNPDQEPSSKDAEAWYDWIEGLGFVLPDQIRQFVQTSARNIVSPRDKTIGKHISEIFSAQ